jgi:hypothetical protein
MALVKRRGFQFDETMSGTYARVDAPDRPRSLSFTVRAQTDSAARALRSGQAYLRGTIRAEGLADDAPTEGTIEVSASARRIRYELSFSGNDGECYRFEGEKRIRLPNLVRSMTELQGDIVNAAGGVVATADLAFDVRADLLPFLASWRPA